MQRDVLQVSKRLRHTPRSCFVLQARLEVAIKSLHIRCRVSDLLMVEPRPPHPAKSVSRSLSSGSEPASQLPTGRLDQASQTARVRVERHPSSALVASAASHSCSDMP